MRTILLLAAMVLAMQPVSAIAQSDSVIAYGPTIAFGKKETTPKKKGDTKPQQAAVFPNGLAPQGAKATERQGWSSDGLVRSQTSIVASPRNDREIVQATKTRTQSVTRSHWTYPGSISGHLLSGHGLQFGDISGLTDEQMKTMHDELHEGTRVSVYSSSTCPNGNCPRQTSQPRLFRWR